MENVEISHLCGHAGYVSPRVSDEESATLVERPCPGCTPADRWAEDSNARMLDGAVCRNCGERGTLRLLYVLVASAPTDQSLAGVQVKTAAIMSAWAACIGCFRWSLGQ